MVGMSFTVHGNTPDPSGGGWKRWLENGWDESRREHAISLYGEAMREGVRLSLHRPGCHAATAVHGTLQDRSLEGRA